ncbi:MFS transporter [Celeribacter marinus]|uniref:Membrane protein mosC n=1 Tax=Celeribacter marinus TaxID=1397108 RepID=A0A0P0A9L6_9RHOB|nr:MFS transporter [Celeribacter marinus]ALI55344.1 membrane protein mosC [Celeribacter marinus]SFL07461.1 Major Facilitator Superfamily protein [Celeribacter marinus]
MSLITAVRVSRAPFMALGAIGVYWGTLAAMVPAIKAQTQASDAQFGLALLGAAIGGMVAMYLAPRISLALGRYILPLLVAVMFVAMQMPAFAHSVPALFVVLVALGATISSLDINANMRLSQLEERHGMHLMNINHAMFSLCFGVAALFVAGLRQAGWSVGQVFPLMGVAVVIMGVMTWEGRNWRPVDPEPEGAVTPTELPWLYIILTGVMLFVSFVGENATEAWSALFIERELGGAVGHGGFGPSTLGFVMAAFRLLGQVTTEKLGEERVVFWSGVLGVIGSLVIASAQSQGVVLVGIGITAIGMAVIVPTANSLLGKLVHRQQRAIAISRAWLIGFTGYFIGPSLIGFVSQGFGLRVAFVCVAIMVAFIIPAVVTIKSRRAAAA